MDEKDNEVIVLGVGNILLKDEGIGVHVIKALGELSLPDNVTLVDGGASGIDLLEYIERAARLIVIDAVDARSAPGSIFRFYADAVDTILEGHKTSLHQVDLYDTLRIAKFLEQFPETIIIGVQPKDIEWGLEPTPELVSQIPKIVELVVRELRAHEAGRS